MKRFAVFAILGPPIAAASFYLLLLPLAGVLEGVPVVIDTPVLPVWSYAVLAALVVAVFDWVASIIELPLRPIGAAIAGWPSCCFATSWRCRICRDGSRP
jgi:hypothetical protein